MQASALILIPFGDDQQLGVVGHFHVQLLQHASEMLLDGVLDVVVEILEPLLEGLAGDLDLRVVSSVVGVGEAIAVGQSSPLSSRNPYAQAVGVFLDLGPLKDAVLQADSSSTGRIGCAR